MKTGNPRPIFRPLLFLVVVLTGLPPIPVYASAKTQALNPILLAEVITQYNEPWRDREESDPLVTQRRSENRLKDAIQYHLTTEEGLSEDARKVKIVTNKGSVILRGFVLSPEEKTRVEEIARGASTTGLIESNLEVRPQQ